MITLYNNESGALLGDISDADLAFLQSHLEEESADDTDYYIMSPTVDIMASQGESPALTKILRDAIGSSDGVEIRWVRS
jgi:hypothetical protein